VPCDLERGISGPKAIIVCNTSSHHHHAQVHHSQSEEGVDTTHVHLASLDQESYSGREIQNSENILSYRIGDHCVIQTVSDHVELLHGEGRIYYVDRNLCSVDTTICVPSGLDTDFHRIGDIRSYIEYQGDIQMFRNKDTPTEIIVLVVVPEDLGLKCEIPIDRDISLRFQKFFRSVFRVVVEGSFRSMIMPLPGWHSHHTLIETACASLCPVLVKHGSTINRTTLFTMIHSNALVVREWNGEMENLYLAHKESWQFRSEYLPLQATVMTSDTGSEVSSTDGVTIELSTIGPSASMGVQAPQLNSAMVVSNVGSPPLVETRAPILDSAMVPSSEFPQVIPGSMVHPLTPDEEEILLVNTVAGCKVTSGECWFVTAEVESSSVEFLVDPGAMVTALSIETFNALCSHDHSQLTLIPLARNVRAANDSIMHVLGYCTLNLNIQGLLITVSAVICKLNVPAILGMDVLGTGDQEFPIELNLRDGLLTGEGRPTIVLHREHDPDCFVVTRTSVCVPPWGESIIMGGVKSTKGRRGPSVGVVEGLTEFTLDHKLVVGRSMVDAGGSNWSVPILVVNSNSHTVTIPAWTRVAKIAPVVSIQAVRSSSEISCLPPMPSHVEDMLLSDDLTPEQRLRARNMLAQFGDVFPVPGEPITGHTDAVQHDIDTGDTRPIRTPLRRLSPTKIREQEVKIAEMLRGGQIEASDSPWSSPTVLVKKKDGTMRFCVDYRRLNCATKKDAFPLPPINDSLSMLANQRWFSTLDLASGYWQVGMTQRAKERSAFSTPAGLFQFRVMPFGLCNAPATFERLMSQVLRGLQWDRCLVYIDDILIFGKTFDTALENLEAVLIRISQFGLQLKSTKCALFRTSLPFLGHIVSRDGLRCDPEKITAVTQWRIPTTVKEVREFLGFAGYYRRFVPQFATIAAPLTALTRQSVTFEWTSKHQLAFDSLRELLTSAPVLVFPDGDLEYVVDCDASDFGVGGVLSQVQDGDERVIAYYSHALRSSQRKYCTTKKELLALIASLLHFSSYLIGPRFQVRTDHASLIWLSNLRMLQGMMARWMSLLGQFHFFIIHRPGRLHANADGVSRCYSSARLGCCGKNVVFPEPDPTNQPFDKSMVGSSLDGDILPLQSGELCIAGLEYDDIILTEGGDNEVMICSLDSTMEPVESQAAKFLVEQNKDRDIITVVSWCVSSMFPETKDDLVNPSEDLVLFWLARKNLYVESGVLWRRRAKSVESNQLVVPVALRAQIFLDCHASVVSGHLGISRTYARLAMHYYWPGMSEYVPDHIQACHTCLARKSPVNRREPMGHVPVYKKFERIAMDILDITTVSDRGNRYILVVADYFSKYTEAYPLPNKTARAVADMLVEQWMARFGFPLVLHSDQGREFENKVIHDICRLMCSVKTRTTPYHPQSDGLVERFNRTVISMLAMFVTAEKTNWDDLLPFLMLAYNSSVHASTGHTPFRIVFGEECSLPGNLVHSYLRDHTSPADLGEYAVWVKSALLEVYDTVRVQQGAAVQRQKRSYDAKAVAREFPIGAWVYRYNPALKKHKCDNAWMGPLRVVREPSGPNVAIQAHPDKPVRYHHKDMLKIVPAPIPAPIWPEERPPDEISLVASSVPP